MVGRRFVGVTSLKKGKIARTNHRVEINIRQEGV